MKYIISLILLVGLTIPLKSIAQAQENSERQKILNFSMMSEVSTKKLKDGRKVYDLNVYIDRRIIKKAERLYLRIIDSKTNESVITKTMRKDQSKKKLASSDKFFNHVFIDKEIMALKLGPIPKGDYYVFFKIRDARDNVYLKRKKLSI